MHLGVLQQHAALIGGPNATSCPICHKLFLGGEALMEHMKHTHKDPNASGVASKYPILPGAVIFCFFLYFNFGFTNNLVLIFEFFMLFAGFYCIPGDHRFMFIFGFVFLFLHLSFINQTFLLRPRTKTMHCCFEKRSFLSLTISTYCSMFLLL